MDNQQNTVDTPSPGKALWMASYPKSGNTWFRCFLSALVDKKVDINKINSDGILSSFGIFSRIHDLNARFLTHKEIVDRIPDIFRYHVLKSHDTIFVKVHEAFQVTSTGKSILPEDVTHKCVYIVRNPLDVAASFANHLSVSIDKAIEKMNDKEGFLGPPINGIHAKNQYTQIMYDWSGHVNSYLNQTYLDVIVLRYEDMKLDTRNTFHTIVKELAFDFSTEEIDKAIALSSFTKLQKAEDEDGFKEKSAATKRFFRQGLTGQWASELTRDQAQRIIEAHGPTMKKLGYDLPVLNDLYR